jgi:lipopolysaccharide export system permease protein
MKTYIKFLTSIFLKSFFYIILIIISLVFIINFLTELEFFKDINTNIFFTIYLALINSPSMIFEIFPFILLLSTQLFYIKLFNNNEIQIFKYSGLKNSQILKIIGLLTLLTSFIIITFYYSLSSNLKTHYLELKTKYTLDGKYLAVITNNGLWIRDALEKKINIVNAIKIDNNYLRGVIITQFDENFNPIQNIRSDNIDIKDKEWIIYDASVYKSGVSKKYNVLKLKSNFDYKKIQNLFSNLSTLSLIELFKLRENYKSLNYSTVETDIQINKIFSYPIYLTLMTILSSIIMFNTRNFKNTSFKIAIGLFLSVIIYYINNFFNVMGNTEKLSILTSVWMPIFIFGLINLLLILRVNEK